MLGGQTDEKVVAEAVPQAEKSVAALEALADSAGPYLCGPELSLADLHLIPVYAYFSMTPEGKKALAGAPRLTRWWQTVGARPSVITTQPKLG
jgi:glutathione S-transferase